MANEAISNAVKIGKLSTQQKAQEKRLDGMENTMITNLKDINQRLDKYGQRPSWATVALITFLSSGFIALLAIRLKGF